MSAYYQNGEDLKYRPTTLEQEQDLFRKMKSGDATAREFLVKNHLLFAANQARRMVRGRLPEDEAISAANFALMSALDRFDPERGVRFTVYLRFLIKEEISNLWKSKNPVDFKDHYPPDNGEFALPLEPDSEDHPLENTDHADYMKKVLILCADALKLAERDLIQKMYVEGLTMADVGRLRGVTRASIHKIHGQVLAKLKRALKRKGITNL